MDVKTLLAVFVIVIAAVGFVAANSITPLVIAAIASIDRIGTAVADPTHCDTPGFPSCFNVGFQDGKANPGISCPSYPPHSANFCQGWSSGARIGLINEIKTIINEIKNLNRYNITNVTGFAPSNSLQAIYTYTSGENASRLEKARSLAALIDRAQELRISNQTILNTIFSAKPFTVTPEPGKEITYPIATPRSVHRGTNSPAFISSSLATTRGCHDGGDFNINRVRPEWVPVSPDNTFLTVEGTVHDSIISQEEWPYTHDSHDQNFAIQLDPQYQRYNSDRNTPLRDVNGNPVFGANGQPILLMEAEWDSKYFPDNFWPAAGDKVWATGFWIFDCGHPPGYQTEIHSPQGVAFTRFEPTFSLGFPFPTMAAVTHIYFSGKGGWFGPVLATGGKGGWFGPVLDGQRGNPYPYYDFFVDLPPRPSPTAQLHTKILSTAFGGSTPRITPFPDSKNPTKIHVVFAPMFVGTPDKYEATIAAGWVASTNKQSFRKVDVTFDNIKVNNEHLIFPSVSLIKHYVWLSSNWHFWINVNGNWFEVPGMNHVVDVKNHRVIPSRIIINRVIPVYIPDNGSLSITTTGWVSGTMDKIFGIPRDSNGIPKETSKWDIFWDWWKGDFGDGTPHKNLGIGIINDDFTAANNFGIGSHNVASLLNPAVDKKYRPDTVGDYNLTYHIDSRELYPARLPGILTVSTKVDNAAGGNIRPSDFMMHIMGTNVSPNNSFRGSDSPGVSVNVDPGSYSVTEDPVFGHTSFGYLTGYTSSPSKDCYGTIAANENKTCIITDVQSPPQTGTLVIVTHVVNNCQGCGGGTLQASNFAITVSGNNPSLSKFQGSESGTTVTMSPGAYTVIGEDKPFYRGSLSPDCASMLVAGQVKTCTVTYVSLIPK
jgi:hypothetical protein